MIQNVVITGASGGIGAATARRFAKPGYRLTLIARRREKLEELRHELKGTDVSICVLDVSSRSSVEMAFAEFEADLLINNAGGAFGLDPAHLANLDDWDRCIDLNVKGLMYCTHAALAGMVKRNHGHIINIGSVAGSYPYPGGNAYAGAKAFVREFSLNLRADLLGTSVRVTCIEPGLVGGTEFSKTRFHGDTARAKKVYEKTQPLTPEDVAETIHYCAALPPHVNINSIELMPVAQAFSPLAIHRS